jgi:hypothetical protein
VCALRKICVFWACLAGFDVSFGESFEVCFRVCVCVEVCVCVCVCVTAFSVTKHSAES